MGEVVPLLGSEPVPAHSFGIVLRYAPAVGVHETEAELRTGETLIRSEPVPAHSFGIVLRYAPAVGVHIAEAPLGLDVALLASLAIPLHRFSFVNCLRRRDRYAEQHSQQRQGDNAAPNQPVFNACL